MRRAAALGADYSHSAAGAATRFYPTRVTNSLNNWEPIVIDRRRDCRPAPNFTASLAARSPNAHSADTSDAPPTQDPQAAATHRHHQPPRQGGPAHALASDSRPCHRTRPHAALAEHLRHQLRPRLPTTRRPLRGLGRRAQQRPRRARRHHPPRRARPDQVRAHAPAADPTPRAPRPRLGRRHPQDHADPRSQAVADLTARRGTQDRRLRAALLARATRPARRHPRPPRLAAARPDRLEGQRRQGPRRARGAAARQPLLRLPRLADSPRAPRLPRPPAPLRGLRPARSLPQRS